MCGHQPSAPRARCDKKAQVMRGAIKEKEINLNFIKESPLKSFPNQKNPFKTTFGQKKVHQKT